MYQINDDIPLGCIYESEDSSTKYCPMCNHDNVPYCQWFEDEPEAAIGIDERPVYCPILPSAEPERKKGKWIEISWSELDSNVCCTSFSIQSAKCSICGKYHTTPFLYSLDYFPYCPNCGAEMSRGDR